MATAATAALVVVQRRYALADDYADRASPKTSAASRGMSSPLPACPPPPVAGSVTPEHPVPMSDFERFHHAFSVAAVFGDTDPHHHPDRAVRALMAHQLLCIQQGAAMTTSNCDLATAKDAIAVLTAEHKAVGALFAEFEEADSSKKKKALLARICAELTAHSRIEGVDPDSDFNDAKGKVQSEYLEHHVKQEHSEMFPKARSASLDLVELGTRMAARKADLIAARG